MPWIHRRRRYRNERNWFFRLFRLTSRYRRGSGTERGLYSAREKRAALRSMTTWRRGPRANRWKIVKQVLVKNSTPLLIPYTYLNMCVCISILFSSSRSFPTWSISVTPLIFFSPPSKHSEHLFILLQISFFYLHNGPQLCWALTFLSIVENSQQNCTILFRFVW